MKNSAPLIGLICLIDSNFTISIFFEILYLAYNFNKKVLNLNCLTFSTSFFFWLLIARPKRNIQVGVIENWNRVFLFPMVQHVFCMKKKIDIHKKVYLELDLLKYAYLANKKILGAFARIFNFALCPLRTSLVCKAKQGFQKAKFFIQTLVRTFFWKFYRRLKNQVQSSQSSSFNKSRFLKIWFNLFFDLFSL